MSPIFFFKIICQSPPVLDYNGPTILSPVFQRRRGEESLSGLGWPQEWRRSHPRRPTRALTARFPAQQTARLSPRTPDTDCCSAHSLKSQVSPHQNLLPPTFLGQLRPRAAAWGFPPLQAPASCEHKGEEDQTTAPPSRSYGPCLSPAQTLFLAGVSLWCLSGSPPQPSLR